MCLLHSLLSWIYIKPYLWKFIQNNRLKIIQNLSKPLKRYVLNKKNPGILVKPVYIRLFLQGSTAMISYWANQIKPLSAIFVCILPPVAVCLVLMVSITSPKRIFQRDFTHRGWTLKKPSAPPTKKYSSSLFLPSSQSLAMTIATPVLGSGCSFISSL